MGKIYIIAVGLHGLTPPIVGIRYGKSLEEVITKALKCAKKYEKRNFPEEITYHDYETILNHLREFVDYDECETEGIFLHLNVIKNIP